jgi:hypothetical protein
MSKSTWTGDISSDWADAGNWSPTGVPSAGSDVTIASGDAVASASIETVNSITDSSDLSFESAGTNRVTTSLDNSGSLHVDDNAGAGGTILNIGGMLTNSHHLSIGNVTLSAPDEVTSASLDNTGSIYLHGSSADQALLYVASSAGFGTAGVLSGYVRLVGDSGIEFASGEITSLASRAHLGLNGSDAFIEDGAALGSNSALTGLASIGAGATFTLHDQVAVSTTGALANDGNVYLDRVGGNGGSSLTLAGALTNSGDLVIGNATLSASDEVTAASLDNTGSINLTGSSANQALLDVTGSAGFGSAGVLSGNVGLEGDSAIEFASGQITSLANGASLDLNGNDAFIEDSTALGSNSALTGLASISPGASLDLENGALLSTTGALVNYGTLELDYPGGVGGSSLTLGALTNSGSPYQIGSLLIGNATLSASDKVMVASLNNNEGSIQLIGSGANQALLDVTGSAGFGTAGVLSGSVELFAGDSAIEFKGGQITSLAPGALLDLDGSDVFVEDSTALGSNSALMGLASIGDHAVFELDDGASVSTTGSLVNDGFVFLTGGTAFAALNVPGAMTNNGSISILSDTETLAGAVGGTGSFSLSRLTANPTASDLQFDSSVSAGQTINETGGDGLTLEQAQKFAGTISGFGTGDTIDATNFLETATAYNFVENVAGTGGTLTLTDGSLTASILMTGDYSKSNFALAPDSGSGTLVKFV